MNTTTEHTTPDGDQEGEGSARGALQIGVLGPTYATYQGAPLDLGGPQQRAVLARLVLARGNSVPASRLTDSLWDGTPPPRASSVLQAHISRLRRLLEPDRAPRARVGAITSEAGGYALRIPANSIDAWRFERLVRQTAPTNPAAAVAHLGAALRLWRGPALAEFADRSWAHTEATRLHRLRALAREQLVSARLEAGEAATLIPEIEALVAEDPFSEERWRLLVLACYRAHRQADALAALRRARATLADELGIDPGPALRSLERDVLTQSSSLMAGTSAAGTSVATPRRPAAPPGLDGCPVGPAADGPLVDRDTELSELADLLARARAGRGGMVLIDGPPGIGRSRLLAELHRLARSQAMLPLTARASRQETEFGFGIVRQLLEPALADQQRRERLRDAAPAVGRILDDPAGTDCSFELLHALYQAVTTLAADRPVVLLVDDLQLADLASLDFLGFLARRRENLPLLIAATVLPAESPDDGRLDQLCDDGAAMIVRPAPLTLAGVETLVRAHLGAADTTFVRACHAATHGNPRLVRHLLRVLEAERIPPDASHVAAVTEISSRAAADAARARIHRVGPAAAAVARAIAVLSGEATLPAVAALAGLPEPDVATSVAALARAGVIRDSDPLQFVEPAVANAVYEDLPSTERALRHEQAARVLDAVAGTPEQVAAHLLKAPRRGDPWVVAVLHRAATDALARGAVASAADYLTRADAEAPGTPDPLRRPAAPGRRRGHQRPHGRRSTPRAGLRDAH